MIKRGDIVKIWWDAGRGYTPGPLYGLVTASGPKTFCVVWESNLTNRVQHGAPRGVEIVADPEKEIGSDLLAKIRRLVPLSKLRVVEWVKPST